MFAWFKSTGEILRENIVSAAELFERSIYVSDCRPQNAYEVWHDNACAGGQGEGIQGIQVARFFPQRRFRLSWWVLFWVAC